MRRSTKVIAVILLMLTALVTVLVVRAVNDWLGEEEESQSEFILNDISNRDLMPAPAPIIIPSPKPKEPVISAGSVFLDVPFTSQAPLGN